MDLLLVTDAQDKEFLEEKAREFGNKFIKEYGVRFSPMALTTREARAKYRKSDPLLKNVLEHGIDLLKEPAAFPLLRYQAWAVSMLEG